MNIFKIAGVQMDIRLGEIQINIDAMATQLRETTNAGAWLTVFPECTTTGYCFRSFDEARQFAEPIDGPSVHQIVRLCSELGTRVVFGFLELADRQLFNAVALVDQTGVRGSYRKIHLPTLGVDRFTTPGNRGFEIIELPEMRIGMNICYDGSFPEAARVLALQGADIIILPTNWLSTSGLTADIVPQARALENHVYFMAINRIGSERGFDFVGKSRICDPRGANLAYADHRAPSILYADIEPSFARKKHLVNVPGEHEIHRLNDRRPEKYGPIVQING